VVAARPGRGGYNGRVSVRSWVGTVTCLGALAAGCHSSPAAPEKPPAVTIRPIHVDSVEVLLQGPPAAHVQGVIGDGCTRISGVVQERGGRTIDITILAERPTDAVCIQIARLYDETLPLPGDFPPGAYVLRVNGVERAFTVS